MQLKGLVKFFTVALILISLYQLSFTFIVQNVESKAHAQARKLVLAESPDLKGEQLENLIEARYEKITDSLQGETVFSIPLLKKYTYQSAKEQELNLGLDLQGGMNVTLEVEMTGLLKSLSNNSKDPNFLSALKNADTRKANSNADFISLFIEEYRKLEPNRPLASLFAGGSAGQ